MFWQSRNYSKCFDNRNNKAGDRKGMNWIHSQMGTGIRGFLSWEWSGTGIPAHLWLLVNEMLLIQGIQFCKNSFSLPPVPEIWIAKDRKTSPPFDKTKRNRASEIWSGRLLGSMINDVWRNERPTHLSEKRKEKQKAGKPRVKGQLRMKTIRKSKKNSLELLRTGGSGKNVCGELEAQCSAGGRRLWVALLCFSFGQSTPQVYQGLTCFLQLLTGYNQALSTISSTVQTEGLPIQWLLKLLWSGPQHFKAVPKLL